jgi:sialate O-acetylesterase
MMNAQSPLLRLGALVVSVVSCSLAAHAAGELRLASVLGSNMVLQQQMPARVWGWSAPGDEVSVEFAGQKKAATADAKGAWKVLLDPMPASDQPRTLRVSSKADAKGLELANVLVGEVWVCSGQSNMGGAMDSYKANDPAAFAEPLPAIRYCTTPYRGDYDPQADYARAPGARPVQWKTCDPENIRFVSATAFYFGRELHRHLKVPVGLVVAALGGTPIEAWSPRPAFEVNDETRAVLTDWEKRLVAAWPDAKENFQQRQNDWLKLTEEYASPTGPYGKWWASVVAANAAGKPPPPMPKDLPQDPNNTPATVHYRAPTSLYNGMIAPLTPMAIRGVIWYQGEGNSCTGNLDVFGKMTASMIREWRKAWGLGDFPFLMVQLPWLTAANTDPNEPADWQRTRDEQRRAAAAVPNAIAVVTFDTGHDTDTHPANKPVVGYRLGLAARALAYGEKLVFRGPEPDSARRTGQGVEVRFGQAGGGLVIKGVDGALSDKAPVKGFAVAGPDGKFHWAEAALDGPRVLLKCEAVPAPERVRYGWANHPVCNLFNREGLPAGPFEMKVAVAP